MQVCKAPDESEFFFMAFRKNKSLRSFQTCGKNVFTESQNEKYVQGLFFFKSITIICIMILLSKCLEIVSDCDASQVFKHVISFLLQALKI